MTATAAQVANDLIAQANHIIRADPKMAQTCRDAALAIRTMLDEGKIDGRTYGGVHHRMLGCELSLRSRAGSQIEKSVSRGRQMLQKLHFEIRGN